MSWEDMKDWDGTILEIEVVNKPIYMPLTKKGKKIKKAMKKTYGSEKKAKQVLYASKNKGRIKGID